MKINLTWKWKFTVIFRKLYTIELLSLNVHWQHFYLIVCCLFTFECVFKVLNDGSVCAVQRAFQFDLLQSYKVSKLSLVHVDANVFVGKKYVMFI